jgi:hypothetical protein
MIHGTRCCNALNTPRHRHTEMTKCSALCINKGYLWLYTQGPGPCPDPQVVGVPGVLSGMGGPRSNGEPGYVHVKLEQDLRTVRDQHALAPFIIIRTARPG